MNIKTKQKILKRLRNIQVRLENLYIDKSIIYDDDLEYLLNNIYFITLEVNDFKKGIKKI